MSYNYLMDTLDGSVGYEINNSELSNNSSLYNGNIKNEIHTNTDLKSAKNSHQQFKLNNLENFTFANFTDSNSVDKKLRFSEKLKTLLKNGGSKNDWSDPYAFSEVDSQHSGGENKALNIESCIEKAVPVNFQKNNVTSQKSIMYSRSVRPQPSVSDSIEGKDCNGDTNLNKNMRLTEIGVPAYTANTFNTSNGNRTAIKVQQGSGPEKYKISSLKNGKTGPSVQPSNSKGFLNKVIGKSKLQSLRATNFNSPLKMNKNNSGKPFNFGQSQVNRQEGPKGNKKHDKHKNFPKGKLLLNQLQKTALLNRPCGQVPRKPFKAAFFGLSKSNQKESDVPVATNSINKNLNKKSLLEESLLGLKSHGIKDFNNGMKSRTTETNSHENDHLTSFSATEGTILSSKSRTDSLDQGKHESLQRIWNIRNKLKGLKRDHHHFGLTLNDNDYDENSNSECLLFQNYWFSVCNDYDSISNNDSRRDIKLSQLKVELRHKIKQLQWRYKDEYRDKVVELLVDSARKQPNLTAFLIRLENSKFNSRRKNSRVKPFNLLKPVLCTFSDPETGQKCEEQAMPCVKFCQQHITCSNNQLLFTACSALRSDNTTCRAAVLNQNWENPLCLQHKRLEFQNSSEMPKKIFNSKPVNRPSQPRKRSRSSTGSGSRSSRSRKRKRSAQKDKRDELNETLSMRKINGSPTNFSFGKQNGEIDQGETYEHQNALSKINPQVISKCEIDESQEVEVGEEVLAMAADLPLELASQATKLLEEHDFTNVLNHIPEDAFNDLFTEDKEEYEPTPQETEELERALEAVDKDVKSLEKLSQTQGILDTLLDEQTIAQTLAQLPEVTANLEVPQTLVPVFYQNGFSNINQLEQTLHDVNKSLSQTVLLNQGTEAISNHFVNSISISNHADVLQS